MTALADSSLQWDRLAAMAMFASKKTGENVVQLVQRNGGVGSPGARQALVTMLTRYIKGPNRAPLRISGREPVPREIKSLDTAWCCGHSSFYPSQHRTAHPVSAHPDAWLGGRVGHKMIFGF